MYEACYQTTFVAQHAIDPLRPEVHEHEWVFRLTVSSEQLVSPGITVDYYVLDRQVKACLPHGRLLNELYEFEPTAENLAREFYEQLKPQFPLLTSVSVGEFEAFMCTYRPTQPVTASE